MDTATNVRSPLLQRSNKQSQLSRSGVGASTTSALSASESGTITTSALSASDSSTTTTRSSIAPEGSLFGAGVSANEWINSAPSHRVLTINNSTLYIVPSDNYGVNLLLSSPQGSRFKTNSNRIIADVEYQQYISMIQFHQYNLAAIALKLGVALPPDDDVISSDNLDAVDTVFKHYQWVDHSKWNQVKDDEVNIKANTWQEVLLYCMQVIKLDFERLPNDSFTMTHEIVYHLQQEFKHIPSLEKMVEWIFKEFTLYCTTIHKENINEATINKAKYATILLKILESIVDRAAIKLEKSQQKFMQKVKAQLEILPFMYKDVLLEINSDNLMKIKVVEFIKQTTSIPVNTPQLSLEQRYLSQVEYDFATLWEKAPTEFEQAMCDRLAFLNQKAIYAGQNFSEVIFNEIIIINPSEGVTQEAHLKNLAKIDIFYGTQFIPPFKFLSGKQFSDRFEYYKLILILSYERAIAIEQPQQGAGENMPAEITKMKTDLRQKFKKPPEEIIHFVNENAGNGMKFAVRVEERGYFLNNLAGKAMGVISRSNSSKVGGNSSKVTSISYPGMSSSSNLSGNISNITTTTTQATINDTSVPQLNLSGSTTNSPIIGRDRSLSGGESLSQSPMVAHPLLQPWHQQDIDNGSSSSSESAVETSVRNLEFFTPKDRRGD